jgi:aryl-alcohol dehydrogenase-like predicted oxidoreductase
MPVRLLGKTGVRVSALGLGGAHIGSRKLPGREAVRIIRAAIDGGLTFMDNFWDDSSRLHR